MKWYVYLILSIVLGFSIIYLGLDLMVDCGFSGIETLECTERSRTMGIVVPVLLILFSLASFIRGKHFKPVIRFLAFIPVIGLLAGLVNSLGKIEYLFTFIAPFVIFLIFLFKSRDGRFLYKSSKSN